MDFDYTTETITPDSTNILTIGGTGALEIPSGTTLQQPLSAIAGALRWNITTPRVEYYSGSAWTSFGTVTSLDIAPGSGISVSGGPVTTSGSITVTNTGVLSVAGTTNEITASTTSGVVTLSTPSTFIAPGSLQYATQLGYTYEEITAAGTTQVTATVVTKTYTEISAGSALSGVILPVPSFTGEIHYIANTTSVEIYVWPNVGASILDGTIDVNTYINPGETQGYIWGNDTWDIFQEGIAAGNSGISISSTPGNTNIYNTGVLSLATGTTGLLVNTQATAQTGALALTGTLNISNGGTGATTTTAAFNALSPLTTAGDLLYHNGTTNVRLPIGTTNQQLTVISGEATWTNSVNSIITGSTGLLANGVNTSATGPVTLSGILNLASGGTNANLSAVAGGIVYSSGSAMAISTAGSSGQALISGGTSTPTWQSVASTVTTNQILEGNGSGAFTANGATFVGSGSYSGVTLSGTVTNPTDATTKQYVDNIATGLIWVPSVNIVNLVGTATSPPGSPYLNDAYIIYPGGTTGVWAGFSVGDLVQYQITGWVNMNPVAVGNRFIVAAYSPTTPSGDVTGYKNYIATISGGTSSAWTWSFAAPVNNWATTVNNTSAAFYGSSWTYSGSLSQWIEFASIQHYYAGTGLSLSGTTFSNTGVLSNVAGTGISVSGATGNVTIANTGVTALTAGSGITLSGSTGSVTVSSSFARTTVDVSTTYTILATDFTIFANAASGAFTVSLPASPTAGAYFNIKKVDQTRNTVTISGNGYNIDKYTTVSVNVPFTSILVQWDSTANQWYII